MRRERRYCSESASGCEREVLAGVIYFIHDQTSRTIKIGCARDPRRRLSTLQISTSNKLILLGKIAGTERTEKKVHELVFRNCAPSPEAPCVRPLCVQGEWFDDRILPFVVELMKSPRSYLEVDKTKPSNKTRPASRDPSLHRGMLVLAFDSGEEFHESFVVKALSPELALAALVNIANARVRFLAHTARITRLAVSGCPTRKVEVQGAFVTQNCDPRQGLSVVLNAEPLGNGWATLDGIKQYSNRWLHGVPSELYEEVGPWHTRLTSRLRCFWNSLLRFLVGANVSS